MHQQLICHSQPSPCCCGSRFAGPGAASARPTLALAAAARPRPGKLPQPSAARAVADSALGASSSTSAKVGGKLLLQNFAADGANSQLRLSIQLVSATVAGADGRGVKAEAAVLDAVVGSAETELDVDLTWDEALGAPGAVVVKNHSDFPVYLRLLSVGADKAAVHFACNGWVYPVDKHPHRLFFTNDACVKEETPSALLKYREDELSALRGDGETADRHYATTPCVATLVLQQN